MGVGGGLERLDASPELVEELPRPWARLPALHQRPLCAHHHRRVGDCKFLDALRMRLGKTAGDPEDRGQLVCLPRSPRSGPPGTSQTATTMRPSSTA